MIDTDKYEGTNWDLKGQFSHTEMADEVLLLLAEVKRLRENESELLSAISQYKDIERMSLGLIQKMKELIE